MSAVWMVAAGWMMLALLLATVIGRGIRLADATEGHTELNFVVDGNPLEAPLPEAVFAAAGRPGTFR
ncbi:hypothetical protein [Blastococcus sp. TF02A-35]|uniref:hypothetical protein n=1 Tax=Blastococcus sp. TF02A-35 TaxID=2559612 RepID=UPI0010736114|nr:hypothetical protein [Blastococcus sp. TF02A_35]TFV53707.1 hypothetical protein E4P43_00160 [Blastococcus sp. TF02A_35]